MTMTKRDEINQRNIDAAKVMPGDKPVSRAPDSLAVSEAAATPVGPVKR